MTDFTKIPFNHLGGNIPSGIPPERLIRRVDHAVGGGLFISAVTASMALAGLWRDLPFLNSVQGLTYGQNLSGWGEIFLNYLTHGKWFHKEVIQFQHLLAAMPPDAVYGRMGIAAAVGLILGGIFAYSKLMNPQNQLINAVGEGAYSGEKAKRIARLNSKKGDEYIWLHPCLPMSKQDMTKHMLIYGSVGAGKTQVILGIVRQVFEKNAKMILYDVKGDFTSMYFDKVALISPWDKRSYGWDVATDIFKPTATQSFAAAIYPTSADDKNAFFKDGATAILVAIINCLKKTKGRKWGFEDILTHSIKTNKELFELMKVYYPSQAKYIEDYKGATTASVVAEFTKGMRMIEQLATAWPVNEGRKLFSFKRWARDDYKGIKQVIIRAGSDAKLQQDYISSIMNALVPTLIHELEDDEMNREIFIICDEFTSMGKWPFTDLVDKGRSKGIMGIFGFQDLQQIKQVYGDEIMKTLSAIVSTHLIGRLSMGDTRKTISEMAGTHKVYYANASNSNSGGQLTTSTNNQHMDVTNIREDELGSLGGKKCKKSKEYPLGFYNDLFVLPPSGKKLLLNFPGVAPKKKFPALVEADWCQGIPTNEDGSPLSGITEPNIPPVIEVEPPQTTPPTLEEQKKRSAEIAAKSKAEAEVRRNEWLSKHPIRKPLATPTPREYPSNPKATLPGKGSEAMRNNMDAMTSRMMGKEKGVRKNGENLFPSPVTANVLKTLEVEHQKENWGNLADYLNEEKAIVRQEEKKEPKKEDPQSSSTESPTLQPKTMKVNVTYQPKEGSESEESPLSEAAMDKGMVLGADMAAPGSGHAVELGLHGMKLFDSVSASQPEPKKQPTITITSE